MVLECNKHLVCAPSFILLSRPKGTAGRKRQEAAAAAAATAPTGAAAAAAAAAATAAGGRAAAALAEPRALPFAGEVGGGYCAVGGAWGTSSSRRSCRNHLLCLHSRQVLHVGRNESRRGGGLASVPGRHRIKLTLALAGSSAWLFWLSTRFPGRAFVAA